MATVTPASTSGRRHRPPRSSRLPNVPRWLISLALAMAIGLVGSIALGAAPAEDETLLDSDLIAEALEVLEDRFVDEDALTSENLTAGAIRGLVEALGDEGHTEYLTPEEYEITLDLLEGRVVGIGVVLDQRSSLPLIVSVIDGSPADRAGLRAGDIIASVDGADSARLPEGALAGMVRGEAGTTVRLGIERPGEVEPLVFEITRADVDVEPASWARIPGTNVAVVRVVQFSAASGQKTRDAIEAALEAGAEGIVLDLRGNPGGLVNESLDVIAAFVDGGVAYLEQGRDGQSGDVAIPSGRTLAADIPLVVLVDYGTASSAEIVAAALRENDRATLVGERTFGTGTILNTFDLSDGSALRIGVLSWLTPAGETIYQIGLGPDHEVELEPGALAVRPADLVAMTATEFSNGRDLPLRVAVGLVAPLTTP